MLICFSVYTWCMLCILIVCNVDVLLQGILDPFSKLLSYTVQNCTFGLQQLMDICSLSGRALTKVM